MKLLASQFSILPGFCLIALLGCSPAGGNADPKADPTPQATNSPASAGGTDSQADKPAASAVSLAVVTRPQFDEIIASHKGKVIFVDCWATWCDTCQKEFPHTIGLHKKHAKDGLQVISLGMDDARDHVKALDFLQEQGANFPNLRSTLGGSDEGMTAFEIPSGLPHFLVYDRQGKLRKTFESDAVDYVAIEKLIVDLLGEK